MYYYLKQTERYGMEATRIYMKMKMESGEINKLINKYLINMKIYIHTWYMRTLSVEKKDKLYYSWSILYSLTDTQTRTTHWNRHTIKKIQQKQKSKSFTHHLFPKYEMTFMENLIGPTLQKIDQLSYSTNRLAIFAYYEWTRFE